MTSYTADDNIATLSFGCSQHHVSERQISWVSDVLICKINRNEKVTTH